MKYSQRVVSLKKIVLTGIKRFEITEAQKPELNGHNDILLKVDSVGVCGSDIHYYNEGKIGDQVIDFPFTIGHECSAVVEEVGKEVLKLKPGDLVSVDPAVACGRCQQCLSDREHTCTNQKTMGCPGQIEGCLSEYIIMPEKNCYKIPENLNGEQAALIEPLSISYYASRFLKNQKDVESVAILGVGPIGLGVLISLKAEGYNRICVTDKLDYRLETAIKNGAISGGNPGKEDIVSVLKKISPDGFDAVFECCGKQDALEQAIEILKPGGTLLIVGIPETDRISFDISKIRRKEIAIQNVRRQNKTVRPVIDLMSTGKLSPEFMITHRFDMYETSEAFSIVKNYSDGVIKAIIRF